MFVLTNIFIIFVKNIMIIKVNIEDLGKIGVYCIKNMNNKKMYIGSTTVKFLSRLIHHSGRLKNNKHKNNYLQKSYNKHGENSFEFSILEICTKNECLLKEQKWIDTYINKKLLYNINPIASGTPNMSKEIIEKRRQTMLRKYKSGELISPNIGKIPWNKGLTIIDTSHLKVKKTISKKVLTSRKDRIEKIRQSYPDVYVYDINKKLLGQWRSSSDLQEWSLTTKNKLPISSRFTTSRMGWPINFLKSSNIQTAVKTGNPYKGLLFTNMPLH